MSVINFKVFIYLCTGTFHVISFTQDLKSTCLKTNNNQLSDGAKSLFMDSSLTDGS